MLLVGCLYPISAGGEDGQLAAGNRVTTSAGVQGVGGEVMQEQVEGLEEKRGKEEAKIAEVGSKSFHQGTYLPTKLDITMVLVGLFGCGCLYFAEEVPEVPDQSHSRGERLSENAINPVVRAACFLAENRSKKNFATCFQNYEAKALLGHPYKDNRSILLHQVFAPSFSSEEGLIKCVVDEMKTMKLEEIKELLMKQGYREQYTPLHVLFRRNSKAASLCVYSMMKEKFDLKDLRELLLDAKDHLKKSPLDRGEENSSEGVFEYVKDIREQIAKQSAPKS